MDNICNKLSGGLFKYMTQYILGAFLLAGNLCLNNIEIKYKNYVERFIPPSSMTRVIFLNHISFWP